MDNLILCSISDANLWTALTAVGTIAMAIVTFCSLRQNDRLLEENKKQLDEMKRQWEEDNKPQLDITLIESPGLYDLNSTSIQIYNYGKSLANNVIVSFEEEFLNSIPVESLQDYLYNLQTLKFRILPGRSIIIPFCDFLDNNRGADFVLFNSKISSTEKYDLVDFFNFTPFKLFVTYDRINQEPEETTLSYNNKCSRKTSIQEELNYIQMQLANFRFDYKNKK